MISNLKYILIIVLTGALFSCQKKEISKDNLDTVSPISELGFNFKVEVKNDMLNFPTRSDYEGALEFLGPKDEDSFIEWENAIGFKSMRLIQSSNEREKIGIVDNLLATLINNEGRIAIEGNVFTLDALAETVSVSSISSFETSGISGKNTTIYSTDDNVLDILEGTDQRLSQTERSRYCDKSKLSWDLSVNGVSNKIDGKVVYQKAGFLNSLQSKIKETFFYREQVLGM